MKCAFRPDWNVTANMPESCKDDFGDNPFATRICCYEESDDECCESVYILAFWGFVVHFTALMASIAACCFFCACCKCPGYLFVTKKYCPGCACCFLKSQKGAEETAPLTAS